MSDAPRLVGFGARWTSSRFFFRRRIPSVLVAPRAGRLRLHYDAEQSPNPESTVRLGRDRDRFGVRKLVTDWRFKDADVDSVVRSAQLMDEALRSCGVGRIRRSPDRFRPDSDVDLRQAF